MYYFTLNWGEVITPPYSNSCTPTVSENASGDALNDIQNNNNEHKIKTLQQQSGSEIDIREDPELDIAGLSNLSTSETHTIIASALEVPVMAQKIIDELVGRVRIVEVKNPAGYARVLVNRAKRGEFKPELATQEAERRKKRKEVQDNIQRSLKASSVSECDRKNILPEKWVEEMKKKLLGPGKAKKEDDDDEAA
jgi:hypothetical protein